MEFASRTDAGRRLGVWLRAEGCAADLVLGLPRGGVVVAEEVARVLSRPLDVLVVRKIGHPRHREFAVGALAEPDVVLLDDDSLGPHSVARAELAGIIAEETTRLREYQALFHRPGLPDLADQTVLLVDDGLATGATAEVAVLAARRRLARKIIVAVPVASTHAQARLERVADEVKALWVDPEFQAVGQYYAAFGQVTDLEVVALLDRFR